MALTRLGPNQSINLATNTTGNLDLTSQVTGTLPAGNGGTGSTTFSPGKVLQVVSSTFSTETSSSSTSYADTGMSVSITPSSTSSKILVLASHSGLLKESSNNAGAIQLGKTVGGGSYSAIREFENDYGRDGGTGLNAVGSSSTNCLDSPNTTSAVVYKTRFKCSVTAASLVRIQQNNCVASITVMEIGA
jgi:hypothetical protein